MKLLKIFIIIAVLFYFSACTDSSLESNSLQIEINAFGNLISDVDIDIDGGKLGSYKSVTNANGKVTVSDLLYGSYKVTPSKQGYKFLPVTSTVTISNGLSSISIAALFTYSKILSNPGIEKVYSMEVTSDRGCIVAGISNTHPGEPARTDFDQYIVKFNSMGEEEWHFRYGIPQGLSLNEFYNDAAYSVKETPDGNFYVAGYVGIKDRFNDFSVIKLDSLGNLLSEWSGGGIAEDYLSSLAVDSDNSFVAAGTTESFGFGLTDGWIKKSGNAPVWAYPYGTSNFDNINDICRVSNGFIFTGTTEFIEPGVSASKLWVYKVDIDGNTVSGWDYSLSIFDTNEATSIAALPDGSVIVAGFIQPVSGSGDAVLIKLKNDGTLDWWKQYGGTDDEAFYSVSPTSDGGYIAAGYKFNLFSSRDFYLVKTSSDGTVEWEKTYVGIGGGDDIVMEIRQTFDGGYAVAGTTWSVSANEDIWIMKLDYNGELIQ